MKRFNTAITKILEDIDPTAEIDIAGIRQSISKALDLLKKGEINNDKASSYLARIATKSEESKPVAVTADFIDILNQSTKTGSVINTANLRKLSQSLNIKDKVLDHLDKEDQATVIQLIEYGIRNREGQERR
jgi:hypothetical protein